MPAQVQLLQAAATAAAQKQRPNLTQQLLWTNPAIKKHLPPIHDAFLILSTPVLLKAYVTQVEDGFLPHSFCVIRPVYV